MKTVAYFSTLMNYARAEAKARLTGTEEEYQVAKDKHEAYRQTCLLADKMFIPNPPTKQEQTDE